MENLFVNTDEYNGRYVALKSFEDYTFVGAGDDPDTAIREARKKGVDDPVIVYIPETDSVGIY